MTSKSTCRLPRRQQQQQDAPGSVNRASINSTSNILAAAARVSPASCIHNISSGGKGVAKCVRFLLEEAIQATADCGDASASAEHDAAADPTPSGPWGRGGELGGSWGYNLGAALQQAQRGAEGQEAAEDAGKEEKAEENAAADADRVSPGQWGRGGELGCSYGRTLGSVLRAAQCGGNNTHQEGVAAGKATTVPHYMLPTASSLLKVADRVGANKANKAAQPSPARRVVRPWR
ncbi:hypothetical protein PLESTF_001551000 [Pleodorina starrii]|nr:hypothetical protein PLESTF_001551000 [Pleodorina starrii]